MLAAGAAPSQASPAVGSPQLIARTDGGFEAVPSASGRAAAITEFSNTNGVASSISTYLWQADRASLHLIARQRVVSTQVALGVNADGTKVAYRCSSSVVCIWAAGRGVVQRIRLPCAVLAKGAQPGRSYVSADLQTIAVDCALAGRFTPSGSPTNLPLIIRHGRVLPTKRLRGYLPLGISDAGDIILGQPYPKPTVVYAGGHLHPLPWGANVFSRNGRYFIGPHGNAGRTITVYDRITGHSRSWTPPLGPLEQPDADPSLVPFGSHSVSAVSNDGTRLIYDDELGTLYVADLQSGALTTLATDVTRAYRSLSADGRTLFYEQHRHPSDLMVQQLPAASAARRTPPFVKPSAIRASRSSRPRAAAGYQAAIAPPLHSVRYMDKHCPITVAVNIGVPGGSVGNKRGLSVRGQKVNGETADNSLPYPLVKYTWHLSKTDQFCGIVGGWYPSRYVSLRPTSQTARGGEYTDYSQKDAASPTGSLAEFFVYAKPVAAARKK